MIFTSGKRMATLSRCRGSVHSSGAWLRYVVPVCSSTGSLCFRRVLPHRVEHRIVRPESRVHGQQLDPAQAEFLSTLVHFALPAFLSGV
jgi:hypothetical protein